MKSLITRMLLLFLWLPIIIKAQVNPELSQKFPANILARIYEVSVKVKLPLQKQMLLGEYFKEQDRLANAAAAKGLELSEINKYYVTKPEKLAGILSRFELNDYSINNDSTASKFAVAIKYREQLNLDESQVESLFTELNNAKNIQPQINSNFNKYEAEKLIKILKNEKYRNLLFIINKEKALAQAVYGWRKLTQKGATNVLDSTHDVEALASYNNDILTSSEYTSSTGDYDKKKIIQKPILAKKLDVINGNVTSKELAAAVKYHEELNLDIKQINKAIDYAIGIESRVESGNLKNAVTNSEVQKGEMAVLRSILKTDEKYSYFLNLKNRDLAIKNAIDDWIDLQKFDLTSGLDSVQINTQNLEYETNLLTAVERMKNSNTPEKVDSVKKAIAANRPKILMKLAAYKKTLPKTLFSDAINYRNELRLSTDQIEKLLDKSKQVEFIKLDNKSHQIYEFSKVKEFEGKELPLILNDIQFFKYLAFKVQDKAIANAKNDWNKLKQFGLTKDLDSVKTYRQNLNYETNMQIAIERYDHDKSQTNAFLKKDLENNKPVYLKQLDAAIKNSAANNDTKKGIAW